MDEEIPYLIYSKQPYPVETIEEEGFIIRQIHYQEFRTPSGEKRKFPNETHFKPDPDGLSVNCAKIIDVRQTNVIIGLSYKHKQTKYKKPTEFKTFQFNIEKILKITLVKEVIHSPVFNGFPHPIGQPNNPGHCLLKYLDDEEIRMNLCDWVRDEHDTLFCKVEFISIEKEIEEIKKTT